MKGGIVSPGPRYIIKVDTDVIQSSIDELNEKSGELQDLITKLNNVKEKLSTIWKGQDMNNFIKVFNTLIQNLNHIRNRIEEHIQSLGKIKSIYEDLDKECLSIKCIAES